ncbi:hypothetical protein BDY21DRAFT_81924 [Lineolata rhizophorae]|uniref:Major facilitator superfamily domain-containing protein n=1 Tax=Lineolata rhizophorae TaxID=578093 RepID=A0A6A6PBL6_9PEZI|nr:hypothetical protein BDY21DRAFT_81924 [Lineolata rhizophorae]
MLSLSFTATRWQVATYLCGVALFSISFLVFLNASISFVITERIGQRHGVGDAVGTLGFADELVALVACPTWGVMSDRIGVRWVAVAGYAIVGLSLFLLVQTKNVYPQLLLARLFFSLGGAATATMVTAILPSMTHKPAEVERTTSARAPSVNGLGHNITPSISSELTITPARFRSQPSLVPPLAAEESTPSQSSTSQLAGLVGMFTGLGALLAVGVFLPLPARFQKIGASPSDAVAHAFYVVGAVGLLVSVACFFGLRQLPGERNKSMRKFILSFRKRHDHFEAPAISGEEQPNGTGGSHVLAVNDTSGKPLPYYKLLWTSFSLAFYDQRIGLGYLGGFVARASTVAVTLFIPLAVNAHFISSGLCSDLNSGGDEFDSAQQIPPNEDMKEHCRRAYVLAATLTGTAQLAALIAAPVFGWTAGRFPRGNSSLLFTAACGVAGYVAFGALPSPDPASDGGSGAVYFIAILIGVSQIGAIVCSLTLLGKGIQSEERPSAAPEVGLPVPCSPSPNGALAAAEGTAAGVSPVPMPGERLRCPMEEPHEQQGHQRGISSQNPELAPLLPSYLRRLPSTNIYPTRSHLKGSIAGMYSLFGGAGILLLTKAGGAMFDNLTPGAPFALMAAFNAILLIVNVACIIWNGPMASWRRPTSEG